MGWWDRIWYEKTEDWLYGWLDPAQTPDGALSGEIEPESGYLSVFLKSARIVDIRKGVTTFYGAVHSYIRLHQRSIHDAEFNVVTTPAALKNIDASHIDRVIQVNQRLLGPVPYVGGDLEMEVGLFSVAGSDLAAPYLALLEQLSRTAGVAFMSSALPFAGPIIEGVRLLTHSSKEVALEVGFSTTQPMPRRGYFVVIRAPKRELQLSEIRVDSSDFRITSNGQPIGPYPYMVLEIRSDLTRSDWFKIPELAAAYQQIQYEYRAGRSSGTEEALLIFRRMARSCNDLLLEDAEKLVGKVEDTYAAAGPPASARRGADTGPSLPELGQIQLYGA